jgi:hypothetical protein
MGEPTSCCRSGGGYCDRCDLLLGLDGLRVIGVDRDDGSVVSMDDAARGDLLVPLWVNGWRSKGRGRPLGWDTLL